MKIAIIATVGVATGLVAAFYGYATSEFTECFAQFAWRQADLSRLLGRRDR